MTEQKIVINLNRAERRWAQKHHLTPLEFYNLKWHTKYTEDDVMGSEITATVAENDNDSESDTATTPTLNQ